MGSSRDSVLSLGPMLHSQKGFEIWFCSSLVSVLLAEFKQSQSIGGCKHQPHATLACVWHIT